MVVSLLVIADKPSNGHIAQVDTNLDSLPAVRRFASWRALRVEPGDNEVVEVSDIVVPDRIKPVRESHKDVGGIEHYGDDV